MADRTYYPVTFKQDETILFATRGFIEKPEGEPHDTAHVYSTAVRELRTAVQRGNAPKNSFEIGNVTVIEYPNGQSKSYTDEQMSQLLDESWELKKYKAKKDSRVVITLEGGITGGLIKDPVDVTLDNLSEQDFLRASQIIDLLQTRRAKLDYADWVGDFGYLVKIGDKDTPPKDMKFAFRGGSFSKTPAVVEELETLLSGYAARPENVAKNGRRRGGPSGVE